jgi:hypothetical protein
MGIVAGAGGCHLMVNPYTDEIAMEPAVTTPSAEQAQAAQVAVTVTQRDYDLVEVRVEDGSVTHGPLYFEDPFEDRGSEDGRFAWGGEEYLYFLHGPGCFLFKGLVFPISAVVTPPWITMASDGRVSQRAWSMVHDARRQAREPVNE